MKTIFIITGPSGVGKSSLNTAMLRRMNGIRMSVSHTTRKPRGKEMDGVQYNFVDKQTFKDMLDEEKFAEWTQIHGNYYGTSHYELQSVQRDETDLILEIEGHGALQIKGQYPLAKTIFILPPSLAELRKRIVGRSEDAPEEIERRLKNAVAEIEYVEQFEYLIVNNEFDTALFELETIIKSDRLSRARQWPALADRFKG